MTVAAQLRILGVDHDGLEEGVDRGLEDRETAQHFFVAARFKVGRRFGFDANELGVERLFGVFGEIGFRDVADFFVTGLLEDVADALVGGGERRGFRGAP